MQRWSGGTAVGYVLDLNGNRVRLAKDHSRRIRFVGQFERDPGHDGSEASAELRLEAQRVEAIPEISFSLGRMGSATATMTGKLCRMLVEHCEESTVHGREVGGLLVGHLSACRAAASLPIHPHFDVLVTDAVPVRALSSSNAHFSIREEEWNKAEEEIRRQYVPHGKSVLGWYHTHPDQGIFFSSKDRTAHELFPEPHQFALVVDPRGMEAGLFHWSSNGARSVAGPICFPLIRRRR